VRRWWVSVALLLSVGFNLGLLAAVAGGRWADRGAETAAGTATDPAPDVEPPPDPAADDEGAERELGVPLAVHAPPLGRLADHLGLEGETRGRFIEVQRRLFGVHVESRLERARLGREMRRGLLAAEADRERVERLIEEMGLAYVAAEKATAETIFETRELLTPQQQRLYLHVVERIHGGRGRVGEHLGGHRRHGELPGRSGRRPPPR